MKSLIFAGLVAFAVYLIVSLPAAYATEIRINWLGETHSVDMPTFVNRTIDTKYHDGKWWLTINVSNATEDVFLETTYLFKCKGLDPATCVAQKTPDHWPEDIVASTEYPWDTVADKTTGYPQVANILLFVKASNQYGPMWQGFWYKIERTASSTFNKYNSDISSADLYASPNLVQYQPIANFIQTRGMIPMNPNWIEKLVLTGATGFYNITSDSPMESLAATTTAGNEIASIDKAFSFVLASNGGIKNPLILNTNPSWTCGQYGCETDKGESSSNCCYDCACPSGQYCDASKGCLPESAVTFALNQTPDTRVTNCYEQHLLNISVKITNPPTGMIVTGEKYILDGTNIYSLACEALEGGVYRCPIVVPPYPQCGPGSTFKYSQNSIKFNINWPDGPREAKQKTMAVSFPDITIGSWVCGHAGCESGLGEDSLRCCYDCACGTGKYCDMANGASPSAGQCRSAIRAQDVSASLSPSNFVPPTAQQKPYTNSAELRFQIANKPSSLSVSGHECSISCSYQEQIEMPCTATCSLSNCQEVASSNPNIYNSTCTMFFSISDYDNTKDYKLTPTFSFTASYNNGPSLVTTEFSKELYMTVAHNWCGDGECKLGETSQSCCWDCPCSSGQYCDAPSDHPSASDTCKAPDFRLVIDDTDPVTFVDNTENGMTEKHEAYVTAHIENAPASMDIQDIFCDFGGNDLCQIDTHDLEQPANWCVPEEIDGVTYYNCTVQIAETEYLRSPFFDSENFYPWLSMSGNSLNFSISYKNGSHEIEAEIGSTFSDLSVNLHPTCGDGFCDEEVLAPNIECCMDCSCDEGYMCVPGDTPTSACVSETALAAVVTDAYQTTSDPDTMQPVRKDDITCDQLPPYLVSKFGYDCRLSSPLKVNITLSNAPVDLRFEELEYRYGEQDWQSVSCLMAQPYLICDLAPPVKGFSVSSLSMNLEVQLKVSYKGSEYTLSPQAFPITITPVDSMETMTCNEAKDAMQKEIDSYEAEQLTLWIFAGVFALAAIGLGIACIWYEAACPFFVCFGAVAACLAGTTIPRMLELGDKIKDLYNKKGELCTAESPSTIGLGESDIGTGWKSVLSKIGLVICPIVGAICIWGAMKSPNTPVGRTGGLGTSGGSTYNPTFYNPGTLAEQYGSTTVPLYVPPAAGGGMSTTDTIMLASLFANLGKEFTQPQQQTG